MKKIVSLLVALSFMAAGAIAGEKPKKADNRLYSLDQFFKAGTSAQSCVGKRLYGKAIVISSEPDPDVEGKFIVTLGEVMRIDGGYRDYFRILKTKSGKLVHARLFFKVRVSEAGGMRVHEDQVFSVNGRVGQYSEVEKPEGNTNGNLYENSDTLKFKDDFKFHGFYLLIPEGGFLTN